MSTQIGSNAQKDKKWFVVDVEDKVLGRAATEVARVLRGKHKATFSPSVDTGEKSVSENRTLVADCKSGTSGAGRAAKVGSLFCEVNEGFKPYGVGAHRHTPEIEQTLSVVAGEEIHLTFTPHLLPINRGILSTCYALALGDVDTTSLRALYQQTYASERFVRLLPEGSWPNVSNVRGSNFCDINLMFDARTNRVIVVAAIDNLVKGAAGQAVQNMNLMLGFEESLGLTQLALFP